MSTLGGWWRGTTGRRPSCRGHRRSGGPDAALALYLTKADPLMVLRDLLGHSSAVTTEAYLRRLDTTRIYADAYASAAAAAGRGRLVNEQAARRRRTRSRRRWLREPARRRAATSPTPKARHHQHPSPAALAAALRAHAQPYCLEPPPISSSPSLADRPTSPGSSSASTAARTAGGQLPRRLTGRGHPPSASLPCSRRAAVLKITQAWPTGYPPISARRSPA